MHQFAITGSQIDRYTTERKWLAQTPTLGVFMIGQDGSPRSACSHSQWRTSITGVRVAHARGPGDRERSWILLHDYLCWCSQPLPGGLWVCVPRFDMCNGMWWGLGGSPHSVHHNLLEPPLWAVKLWHRMVLVIREPTRASPSFHCVKSTTFPLALKPAKSLLNNSSRTGFLVFY